jgi:exopolysaccharide biosynthesis polyprenyl glycosylphosphotransferase
MIGDLGMSVIAITIALRVWAEVANLPFDLNFIVPRAFWYLVLPLLWLVLASANDFYDLRASSRIVTSFTRMIAINIQIIVVYLLIFFFGERDELPRLFILYYAVLSFILIGLWRAWRPFLVGWSGRRRALVIGTGWAAETILKTIANEAPNEYQIVGCIGDSSTTAPMVGGRPVLGTGTELPNIVREREIAELILAFGSDLPSDVFQGIMACYEIGITMIPMPLLYEQITGRVPIEHIGAQQWTIVLPIEGRTVAFTVYLSAKRAFDILFAMIGLLCFAIALPIIALVMTIDSPGPIFYQQERVGRGGRSFKVIKLRSMIPDAERQTGAKWATADDPRITRVGRILRKTRLDEVPQLVNVLRGEMSVVGPRPERPIFVEKLTQQIPFYRTRLVVNPGLTGWAQVRYKYGNTTEDALVKLQYDLYYIRHQSLTLDLLIMLRTVGKVLAFQGT